MEIGNKVRFLGCSVPQTNWGGNDSPTDKLMYGHEYIISDIEVHSWHTKISLMGIEGKFNSVCFDVI